MTRRLTKLAVVYLLLGLVVTWAVAWGAALRTRHVVSVTAMIEASGPPYRMLEVWTYRGGRRLSLRYVLSDAQLQQDRGSHWLGPCEFDASWPRLARPLIAYESDDSPSPIAAVEARGWPFLAVWCDLRFDDTTWTGWLAEGRDYWADEASIRDALVNRASLPRVEVFGGLRSGAPEAIGWYRLGSSPLPYRPLWPGLIANTVFYAAVFLGLHQLVGVTRRSRRRRRGLCPVCRYDLRADYSRGCSECGWRRFNEASDVEQEQ